MSMAKEAGLFAIWARYGAAVEPHLYERLIRVSHWTPQEVEEELEVRRRAASVRPDAVLENGFHELLSVLHLPSSHSSRLAAI
jgi:phosphoglycolate phosphatase